MRQNEYVSVIKMAICVPNSEASHVMSGLEKRIEICSTTNYLGMQNTLFQLLSVSVWMSPKLPGSGQVRAGLGKFLFSKPGPGSFQVISG